MPIGENKSSGTWWKVLLGVVGGFFLGIGAVAGGLAIAGTMVKTKDLVGPEIAEKYVGESVRDKTVLQIVMSTINGEIKFDTVGDLNSLTPLVGDFVIGNEGSSGVMGALNGIGCELTPEAIYAWSIAELPNEIIGSVHDAKLVRVLNGGNNPAEEDLKPVVKYLSFATVNGKYVDANGNVTENYAEFVPMKLSDLLNNPSFIQNKVDSMTLGMLFTEEDIEKSEMLKELKDKTVKELANADAFDQIKLGSVIHIDTSSPKILQALAETKIGGMGDRINSLEMGEVIDIDESSPKILKALEHTPINNLGDKINSLTIAEVVDINEDSPKILKAIQGSKINELGTAIDNLTVDDVFDNREDIKFLKNIEGTTKVSKIGEAINNMPLLDAFEDNIFKGGNLDATWKYMLIEEGETWITGTPSKESNPFGVGEETHYACAEYTVGSDTKGINKLVENMSANMSRVTLNQLDADGIMDFDNENFLNKPFTGVWEPIAPSGKATFGELTLDELTEMVTHIG